MTIVNDSNFGCSDLQSRSCNCEIEQNCNATNTNEQHSCSEKAVILNDNAETEKVSHSGDDSDHFSEIDDFDNRPSGNTDTVMHPVDFREFNQILSVAPGEGNTPIGLFEDHISEFLAFPTIYCGQARRNNNERKVPLHYSTICKWELRNVDRRVAKSTPNLFYKMKRLQIKQIKDKVNLAIRKCKTKGKKITVGDILSPGGVDKLVKLNEGYRVLRSLRGSPPYWEQAKKDIFAMIRQLGLPTWFISLSAAETKWLPLLKILAKLIKNKDYTDDEINSFTWEEKCNLIRSDPVTCVRYFDVRVQKFMTMILKDEMSPIGEISDFFQRIEFQQRGSPHVHMLVWVKDAPIYGKDTEECITNFIDNFVSCENNLSMPELINYQSHRHARTCRKKGKAICRFGFPIPPMPKTVILTPLDEFEISNEIKNNFEKLSHVLDQMKSGEDITFDEFLEKLEMDYDSYILAVRSNLNADKVFLRRRPSEIRVNNYNPIMLKAWEANLDIQYILDPYACVAYIVSYISKGQRGMSNLLYEACKEAKEENSDIRQQVRRIGNQFLNHVEVGAQEAAYLTLQLPLRRSSRSVLFINTSPEEERTVLLKSMKDMAQMPKTSANIESDNIIKRYQRRPKLLSTICLADFASWFTLKKTDKKTSIPNDQIDLPEEEYSENVDDDVYENEFFDEAKKDDKIFSAEKDWVSPDAIPSGFELELKNGCTLIKRHKQRILRYVRFNIKIDRENHFRELLMLFYPWRKEKNIMGAFQSYEQQYNNVKDIVYSHHKNYEKSDGLEDIYFENQRQNEDILYDGVAPGIEHEEAFDRATGDTDSELFGCFDPGNCVQGDIGLDIGVNRIQYIPPETVTGEMPDKQYREMIQSLNVEQKEFFYHVLHWFKTRDDPLYNFLSGGGGVGKSVVTRALYQSLLKYFLHQTDQNPDELKLLLCAPTGKAAHNIGGSTIHSTFCIPVGQGYSFKPLDMQQLNVMRAKFCSLKLLFIDEISMVGRRMLNFLNLRLQEIKGSTKPFGGVSIVAIGDLFQLKPMLDKWIFEIVDSDYGVLAANIWEDHFSIYELKQIMRQKDDFSFAELLNRFREGHQTKSDMEVLRGCLVTESEAPKDLPHLFTTRAEVNRFNDHIFSSVESSKKTTVTAIDTITGDLTVALCEQIKQKIPNDPSKTMGLLKNLQLCEDVQAEICINIDVEDGLTNGTPGIVRKLDFRVENSSRCSIIWMEFYDSDIGQKLRNKYRHLFIAGIQNSWTPILEITKKFQFQYYKPYYIVRRQFPICMAAARTIHKAQGATYEGAVVHFGNRKIDHIHYVGLSRVKVLSNLYILDLNEHKIKVSQDVECEMTRLRNNKYVVPCLPSLYKLDGRQTKIVFHNVRSLNRHITDVRTDYNLMDADVLAFAETRLMTSECDKKYSLDSFKKLYRFDSCDNNLNTRPYHGMALYMKENTCSFQKELLHSCEVMFCKLDAAKYRGLQIGILYCKPESASLENLKKLFTSLFSSTFDMEYPLLLMGDLNYDVLKSHALEDWILESFGCRQMLHASTTDYGSCLDHIYTNLNSKTIQYGTLESYFSDHKPIYFSADFSCI